MRVTSPVWVAILAATVACDGGSASGDPAPVEETVGRIEPAAGVDAPEAVEPADPQRVMVRASSFAFQPSSIVVGKGSVRFVVSNAADVPHGFEVEGEGMEEETGTIPPGATDSLTYDFETPGEYEIYCPVGDHRSRGMTGTLTVE